MALESGRRLGPYEILAPIGSGGMGEVYRARDTRLQRDVAIKVLPVHLSKSPEVRARFEREARAASSLNHPNICAVYDIGSEDGVDYIVMEHLEGETLARRLESGPLPLGELGKLGSQIADALEKAHRQGLVHRDLKPGNVMLTKGGAKLMDFGLAKMTESLAPSSLTAAPTATSPLTTQGTIMGTVPYMSPEQLEGREADARSDIFSLGVVLYEMASGRRAFIGATQASVIASILKDEPPRLAELAPATPAALDRLVKACIVKDADERIQSAHDVKMQLGWIASGGEDGAAGSAGAVTSTRAAGRSGWYVAAGLLLVAALGWGWALWGSRRAVPRADEIRFTIESPPGSEVLGSTDVQFAASPDGARIAFAVEATDGSTMIHVRALDEMESHPVAGTEGCEQPFWSPDGRTLGFKSGGAVKTISAAGGAARTLVQVSGGLRGADWGAAGTILLGFEGGSMLAVPEAGGDPRPVTNPGDEAGAVSDVYPSFLPDGKHFLFLRWDMKDVSNRAIYVGSLDGGEPRRIVSTRFAARYVEPGYLLYIKDASLYAQAMRLDPPGLSGEPFPVVDEVGVAVVPGQAAFTASASGVILYRNRSKEPFRTRLEWLGRDGAKLEEIGDVSQDVSLSLSPDGERAVMDRVVGVAADSAGNDPPTNLWSVDLRRGVQTRLTTDSSSSDENPVWSPDGRRIAYASHDRGADAVLLVRTATGTEEPRAVPVARRNPHPHGWSPDGTKLIVHVTSTSGKLDLMVVPVDGKGETVTIGSEGASESQGVFSPDGRWIAYSSDVSGAQEVYVRSYPEGDEQLQVSNAGGAAPVWRADGKEIYYVANDRELMAVTVQGERPALEISAPKKLFEVDVMGGYYVYGGAAAYAPDSQGRRFLVSELLSRPQWGGVRVVLNWRRPAGS